MNSLPASRMWPAVVGVAVLTLALTGCATSTVQYGSPTFGSAVIAKPLNAYLLTQADVPGGFRQQPVPSNLPQRTDSLLRGIAGSDVTPPSCSPPAPTDAASELQQVRTAAFVDLSRGQVITSAVNGSSKRATVDDYRRYNLGTCASISVRGTVGGRDFASTVTTSRLDVRVAGVPRALVLRQSVTNENGGRTRSASQLLAVLPAPSATILVTLGSLDGTPPNEGQFRTIVAAAGKRITER